MTSVTLLDGGMGQELLHRSGDTPTRLWATQVMLDHPGLVAEIHRAYFAAGATVATTNTYALHPDRFVGTGLEHRLDDLFRTALDAAQSARGSAPERKIAGSIGPLAATYRPELHPDHTTAQPLYAAAAKAMQNDVDFILCETVASLSHARSILAGAATTGLPVWLSVTVDDHDGRLLRSGEPVAEVCAIARDGAAALLANCSAPEAMARALNDLAMADLPFGAYANGFQELTSDFLKDKPTADALSARRDLGPDAYADYVLSWVDQGATIVGGCCEIGPPHIATLSSRLRQAGHTII